MKSTPGSTYQEQSQTLARFLFHSGTLTVLEWLQVLQRITKQWSTLKLIVNYTYWSVCFVN
jgi:hypothetical protein